MFTETGPSSQGPSGARRPGRPGRPRGATPRSAETRETLYRAAIARIAEVGYEAATLRDIAARAGVSPTLLYRYFPGKRSVLLALYDDLSLDFERSARTVPPGRWRDRFLHTLRASLDVLAPHRDTLAALVPVLVGSREEGLFASATAFSRERVQGAFVAAATGARDAPKGEDARALGRVLYLVHLAVLLFWLLDRSPRQTATARLVGLLERTLPAFALGLRLRPLRDVVRGLDAAAAAGFLGGGAAPSGGGNPYARQTAR